MRIQGLYLVTVTTAELVHKLVNVHFKKENAIMNRHIPT